MVKVVRALDEEDLHAQINDIISHAADAAFLRDDSLFRIGVSGKENEITSHVCVTSPSE